MRLLSFILHPSSLWPALLCLVVAGCGGGEKTVPVRGRVHSAGEPLHVKGRDIGLGMVQIQFYRLDEDGQQSTITAEAVANADGRFDAPGRQGRGIPPGKYRIAVRQWDPYPQVDKLQGKFDEKRSRVVREIPGEGDLDIDVSKPEG
jgi:hypothetical protein